MSLCCSEKSSGVKTSSSLGSWSRKPQPGVRGLGGAVVDMGTSRSPFYHRRRTADSDVPQSFVITPGSPRLVLKVPPAPRVSANVSADAHRDHAVAGFVAFGFAKVH